MAQHELTLTDDDEFDLITAFREGDQGGVLRWLGQRKPPPEWALSDTRFYISDELELDDNPMSSEDDGGCWVSAWLWAPAPPELDPTVVTEDDEP